MDLMTQVSEPALLRQELGDLSEKELAIAQAAVRYALNANSAAQVPATGPAPLQSFQDRVDPWLFECFGAEISADRRERNHRFLEESVELVQACGCTHSEAIQLVNYVYGRDIGEIEQEVGGVMVTLAALCLAHKIDMHDCGEVELARIWTKIEKIRAKQAGKPKHSPLPQAIEQALPAFRVGVEEMSENHQITYWVCLDRGDRPLDAKPWDEGRITPFKSVDRDKAEFEAAEWSEFLLGTPPAEFKFA